MKCTSLAAFNLNILIILNTIQLILHSHIKYTSFSTSIYIINSMNITNLYTEIPLYSESVPGLAHFNETNKGNNQFVGLFLVRERVREQVKNQKEFKITDASQVHDVGVLASVLTYRYPSFPLSSFYHYYFLFIFIVSPIYI